MQPAMDLTEELNKALKEGGTPAEPIFRFASTVVLDVARGHDMGDIPLEQILSMFFCLKLWVLV